MTRKTRPELIDDNLRWVREELERRRLAKRAAARHNRPADGLFPIRLPSLAEVLDEVEPPQMRHAGGEA